MGERREGIQGVWDQFEAGVGFVVAGHNYGRLDRLSEEELRKLKTYVGAIANDADRLLQGIGLAECELDVEDTEVAISDYALE